MGEIICKSIKTHQILDHILVVIVNLLKGTLHLNLNDWCFINYLLLCCIIFGACHCHMIDNILPSRLPLLSKYGLLLSLMIFQRIVQYVYTAVFLLLVGIFIHLKTDRWWILKEWRWLDVGAVVLTAIHKKGFGADPSLCQVCLRLMVVSGNGREKPLFFFWF